MNLFGKWKDKATEYVDVRVQLMKLQFIERTSKVLSSLMFGFVLLIISLTVLVFMGFGIMETLSSWFNSRIGGAFATSGVFLLLLFIFVGIRKRVMASFAGIFIRTLTDDPDDDEKERKQD